MTRGQVLGVVGGGCALIFVAVVGAVVFLGYSSTRDTAGVAVTVEAPLRSALGSHFEIVATVENRSGAAKTLVDVDVADRYLGGVALGASTPPFTSSEHVPIDNTISHHFGLALPPGGTARITFGAVAAHAGDYQGDFDFCIDSDSSCVSYHVRTVIVP